MPNHVRWNRLSLSGTCGSVRCYLLFSRQEEALREESWLPLLNQYRHEIVGIKRILLHLHLAVDAVHGRNQGNSHEADNDAHEDNDRGFKQAGETLEFYV